LFSFFFPFPYSLSFLLTDLIHWLCASVSRKLLPSVPFFAPAPLLAWCHRRTLRPSPANCPTATGRGRYWQAPITPAAVNPPQVGPRCVDRRLGPIAPIRPGLLLASRPKRASVGIKGGGAAGSYFSLLLPVPTGEDPPLSRSVLRWILAALEIDGGSVRG
jgi:hypothetical protein